jgi:hypothetical protein
MQYGQGSTGKVHLIARAQNKIAQYTMQQTFREWQKNMKT